MADVRSSSGRPTYFLAMRQESKQRSAPSSPPAAPVPSLQVFPAAGPDRESRAGLPRRKYFPLSGSEGMQGSVAACPSPQPSPARGEERTRRSIARWFAFHPLLARRTQGEACGEVRASFLDLARPHDLPGVREPRRGETEGAILCLLSCRAARK